MVGEFGQVTVLDWGVAKVTGTDPDSVQLGREDSPDRFDQLVGTPAWMSPEQAVADHEAVEERTDVFALGALLYFILTAHSPYRGALPQQIWMAQAGEVVPVEEREVGRRLPAGLVRIAMKAMSPEPRHRYASAVALGDALEGFLRGTWNLPQRHWQKGDCIISEGELGDTAYVVVTGSLEVHVTDGEDVKVLRALGPGDVFGEMAVFTNRPRSATVIAISDVELIEVTRGALADGVGLNSWMGSFVTALAERFHEADRALRGLE
jgi:serine/threonine-protein kinase